MVDNQPPHVSFLEGLLSGKIPLSKNSPLLEGILANLANKIPCEGTTRLLSIMESLAERVLGASNTLHGDSDEERIKIASILAVVTGAITRRVKGGSMSAVLAAISRFPDHPRIGHELARQLEKATAPILEAEDSVAVVIPTWKAKTYYQLVRPMLPNALPQPGSESGRLLTCSNYRIAVLNLLRHMSFSVYGDDIDTILRISLCLSRELPKGRETTAALNIIHTIINTDPDAIKDHLATVVRVCQRIVDEEDTDIPTWMPEGYVDPGTAKRLGPQCQILALRILTSIPEHYDRANLQVRAASASVNRTLVKASGLRSRALRESVRTARNIWRTIVA